MKAAARSRCDRIRAQLADLKMPGALEAIEQLLGAQITLRNNRRLQLPALDRARADRLAPRARLLGA